MQAFSIFKGLPFSSEEGIEAVSDEVLKNTICELEACKSPTHFEEFKARKGDRVSEFGYSRIYSSVNSQKATIISSLLMQAFVYSVNVETHQFLDGLNYVGNFGQLMISNPNVFVSLMCKNTNKLSASQFMQLYTVEFSAAGANKRELEEQTVFIGAFFERCGN